MLQRTSKVNSIEVDSAGIGSVIQIGDSTCINSFSRALAVQRQHEIFFSNEADFRKFPIFSRTFPFTPFTETIRIATKHENPIIKVGRIDILGVSTSSLLHIGNSEQISMESRIKHIRHLHTAEENTNEEME
jgi:spore germination protein PE